MFVKQNPDRKNLYIYSKDFMKITFESDDDLPLGKPLNIPNMITVAASVFGKDGKYYPQVYLHECLYELWNVAIQLN